MADLLIDRFDDVETWAATQPDGTPSTELAMGLSGVTGPTDEPAARVTAGDAAVGHRLQRSLPAPVDLRPFEDLVLWVRGDRIADGDVARPFTVELRLGSAARPIDANSNTWRRFVPFPMARRWAPVLIGVGDLPANVRSATNQIRLVAVAGGWSAELAAIRAVRAELVPDVDAALVARFGGRLSIDGAPVPARMLPATAAIGPGPRFDISAAGVRANPERIRTTGLATDFTANGFVLRPAAQPIDLTYRVLAVAPGRAEQSRMMQFLLDELSARPTLVAAGMAWPVELAESDEREPGESGVTLRIAAAQRASAERTAAVPPFNTVAIDVDQRAG